MAGRGDVPTLWEILTDANVSAFGTTDYGLAEGDEGSLVVFDSPNALNAFSHRSPPNARSPGRRAGRPDGVERDSG